MKILLVLALSAIALPAAATVKTRAIEYDIDGASHMGFIAYDNDAHEPRPGVLVVPEGWGLNDYAKMRARQLAQAGYVAFAADMYGNGKTTRDPKPATAWSKAAHPDLRTLTAAALEQLSASERVDGDRLGAIGFCFGGTSVLELAFSGGAPVDGVAACTATCRRPATPWYTPTRRELTWIGT